MNKLIWSAFAMSLIFPLPLLAQTESVDDFLGLETEVLPDLKGKQRFSPQKMHQTSSWNVTEEQVEQDSAPLKGQQHSLIAWDRIDPDNWMDIQQWLNDRKIKDKTPDWKIRLRDDRQNEHVGKVLTCVGSCEVFRGTNKAAVQHLSRIDEGDELRTGTDTTAWVFLMDGTLVRIGPDSSLSFQEINWSPDQVFFLMRLNQGHAYWHPREKSAYPVELGPETDAISLPLLVRESNQQWFEREVFQKQTDFERSLEAALLEEKAVLLQIAKLNAYRSAREADSLPASKVMMVAPNVTIIAKDTSFDLFHYPGGKSHFKARREGDIAVNLRGYSDTDTHKISDLSWFEVEPKGRSYEKVSSITGKLEITELLTRRIRTLELAREVWLEKYTLPVLGLLKRPAELAKTHGYYAWGDEMEKRYNFLIEYTRRIETTNLRSMENLLTKLEGSGVEVKKEMDDSHYKAALSSYLMQLKLRYRSLRTQVREMNDLQYYVWILRHGKKKD